MIPQDPARPASARALHYPGFRLFYAAMVLHSFAVNILSIAVGLQIWDVTQDPINFAYVGVVQFLPPLLFVLVTGTVADRVNRRLIMAVCLGVEAVCALGLVLMSSVEAHAIWPIFVALAGLGLARAFFNPAADSLAPNLVPEHVVGDAVTVKTTAWQIAAIAGPAVGGLLYAAGAWVPYSISALLLVVGVFCTFLIPKPPQRISTQAVDLQSLLAGFTYIWKEKLVLGAITLDLFAVLLGGAVALLPIYGDLLGVSDFMVGVMRAAPAVGALLMAVLLSRFPVRDNAGRILFLFVFLFGVATVVFGLSQWVWLSIAMLLLIGAFDMVSVVIRETLLQLWTPDALRGRVSAVNRVFIGASNELGETRAGLVAARFGAVAAVVIGGVGTMAVAALFPLLFPALYRARHLDRKMVDEAAAPAA